MIMHMLFLCYFSNKALAMIVIRLLDRISNKFLPKIVSHCFTSFVPTTDSARPFSVLGLGYILIPGRITLC